ncbi:hypothetical protein TUBRATIS_29830 [Tubulinosema ratisbonensis]|uniref:Uncharacterized protein n=1 Tax=Tubulinosema ratisbonensis TaxID=291195 RepID=A0A437AHJ8_9MICR|nr:hypothetical protein TUBRATIS_29830 [Tubulinosema ratisbonensis]
MNAESGEFFDKLKCKCITIGNAIRDHKNALKKKEIAKIQITREDFKELEKYYIELIAYLVRAREEVQIWEVDNTTEEYEKRMLREQDKRMKEMLERIFNSAQEFLNNFDSHFETPEMKAYLFKMKADFLCSKAKILGIQDNNNILALSKSYYKEATILLENNPWVCPYKLDVYYNFIKLQIFFEGNNLLIDDLSSKYELAILYSDKIQKDWKYFSEVLRSIEYFIHKNDKISVVSINELLEKGSRSTFLEENFNANFVLILNEEEYLKYQYFF